MKAVLIGTDFIKTSTGEYKVLEMNSNISLGVIEYNTDILDWSGIQNLVSTNQFKTINLIYPPYSANFKDKIVDIYKDNTEITINFFETQLNSITVPYVEDADDILTIRLSYDTTAIIDDEYCKDKYNFDKALGNDLLKPKAFIPNVTDDFSSLTEFTYEGSEPNFIIKKRYPLYNKYEFPKLYKVTSLEELNTLKGLVEPDVEFLQEYVISETVNGTHSVIRNISLIYGSNLDVISLGGYKINHSIPNTIWENTYNTNNELDKKDRAKYITYYYDVSTRLNYLADTDDDIVMGDGTTKIFKDIVVGDVLKSVVISGLPEDETTYSDTGWTGSYQSFVDNFEVITTTVEEITESTPISDLFIKITVDGGIVWEDVPWTIILVKEGDNIRFKEFNDLVIGDVIEMVDIVSNLPVNKTIENLEIVFKYNIVIANINVETKDVYLPLIANNLTLIQHNQCNAICNRLGPVPSCRSYPQCYNCAAGQCSAK
jgi:hypothetical protein